MESKNYIQEMTPFHDSLIWQYNRDYYQEKGIEAWSSGDVPHNITSNSYVGQTYASLIMGMLIDLAEMKKFDKVYILELGSGHGRLCFHVLQHLEKLVNASKVNLPSYCFVVSDISEKNIEFYANHEQLKPFFDEGKCDYTFYDAMNYTDLFLFYSKKIIQKNDLNQVIIVIANYFFDSIPQDLYHIKDKEISEYYLSIKAGDENIGIKDLSFEFEKRRGKKIYELESSNSILNQFIDEINDSCILFPNSGLACIEGIKNYSKVGMYLIAMDKGAHLLSDLDHKPVPDIVAHGSLSMKVNFNAFIKYCDSFGGKSMFCENSNFHVELGSFLCMKEAKSYHNTSSAYENHVNIFGPDDHFAITKSLYENMHTMTMKELLHMIRFSAFDSTFFYNIMPNFKRNLKQVSVKERDAISGNLFSIWQFYFNINEPFDLAFEIGGMLYDLGYYGDSLNYFQHSLNDYGESKDAAYNRALCLFQLNRDTEFTALISKTMDTYPDYARMEELRKLISPGNLKH